MGFYQELSKYYDEIFAVDAAEMGFVASLLRGRESLLDIGCGTGNKTVLLSDTARITGVDADPGMIERARADNARPGVRYDVLDMTELGGALPPGSFDAAVCLGNTLVHLTKPEAVNALCRTVHALLVPGGVFACQILNYARILDRKVTELPVIDTAHTRFVRRYVPRGGLLGFATELTVKETGETFCNETPLLPLRPEALEAALGQAGFTRQEHYGSYAGGSFNEDSFVIITAAVA
ncbi:class I SAM-dependent methyltransferase [Desulfovibrio sp. OttesenSCG-928-O18]|nr:class I SAM-dependent methyltransferase [Desulfovibrio sp. OttesenSCG-928-O18]